MLGFSLLNMYFCEGAKMNQANSKRRIAILHGSDTDLPQMKQGVDLLASVLATGLFEITVAYRVSIHRNDDELLKWLDERHHLNDVDVMVMGAGCAAHLPGVCDAHLRYHWGNDRIVVVGVGFEDPHNWRNSAAAELSISQVPGTQVVCGDELGHFIGEDGFLRACRYAVGKSLLQIILPARKLSQKRTFEELQAAVGSEVVSHKA